MAVLSKEEALIRLEAAWNEYYAAEMVRIEDDVAFLREVRQGISGSADLKLATIKSAEPFVILEINNFLED
jgi:hypothetical protein